MPKKKPQPVGVVEFLTQRIEAWPTLYRSRLSALINVFTYSGYTFEHGFPTSRYEGEVDGRDEKLDQPLDETPKKDSTRSHAMDLLYLRSDREKALFVRRNAALIAQAEYGPFGELTSTPRFSSSDLNQIDLDKLTPEWRDALIELCKAIKRFDTDKLVLRKKLQGITQSYIDREVYEANASKKVADECLTRLGQGRPDSDAARAEKIAALRYAAKELGFDLTKIDPAKLY